MGKLAVIFVTFLAINTFMISAKPFYAENLTPLAFILEKVCLLLDASTEIVNRLLSYLTAQIDQLIFDVVDELLNTVVQTLSDFIKNLFDTECYKSVLSRIPAELQELLKKFFCSFACLLNEIVSVLVHAIKILGELIGRRTVLQEFTSLTKIIIQDGLESVRCLTRNSLTDPQVLIWVKDTANDITQCSNLVLKGVTKEIELTNALVDKCGQLVSKVLHSLFKCVVLDLNSIQLCFDSLNNDAKAILNELKETLVLDNAVDICQILTETQKCVNSAVNNLKENMNHVIKDDSI